MRCFWKIFHLIKQWQRQENHRLLATWLYTRSRKALSCRAWNRAKRKPCRLCAVLLSLSGLSCCAGAYLLICVSPHPLLISICPHINPFISFLSDKRFMFVVFIESMMLSVPSLCRTSSGPLSLHLSALHVPVWLHSVNEIWSQEARSPSQLHPHTSCYLSSQTKDAHLSRSRISIPGKKLMPLLEHVSLSCGIILCGHRRECRPWPTWVLCPALLWEGCAPVDAIKRIRGTGGHLRPN